MTMKSSILTVLLCTTGLVTFSQWFQHTGIPVTSSFNEVCFPDPRHGWIVGAGGTILYSGDGGENWSQQFSNIGVSLSGISMTDSLHGWAVGHGSEPPGLIIRTDDGGMTWEAIDTSDHNLQDVFFVDPLRGWVIGANVDVPAPGLVKTTVDGGNTWTDQLLPGIMFPNEVVFVNPQVGYIGGTHRESDHFRMKVLKTTDAGTTWNPFIDWGVDGDMFFSDMMFLDSLTGWISGSYSAIQIGGGTNDNGFITRIENGAAGWYDYIYEDAWKPLAIYFTTPDSGWGVGQSGLFMDTQDNGEHWTIQNLPPNLLLVDITFADDNHGWAVGKNGTVLFTENNGYTGIAVHQGVGNATPELIIFPDPASSYVQIRFEMKSHGKAKITLHNTSGQFMQEIFIGDLSAGTQSIGWPIQDLPQGIYFVRVMTPQDLMTKKLIIRPKL